MARNLRKEYFNIGGCFDSVQETEKAICINGTWIPKSQLVRIFNEMGYCYTIYIPCWLFIKNNLSDKLGFMNVSFSEEEILDNFLNEETCGAGKSYANMKLYKGFNLIAECK